MLCPRSLVLLFERAVVERDVEVRSGLFVTALEELRPDVALVLNDELRPVELVTELLRLDATFLEAVELRPLSADDEA